MMKGYGMIESGFARNNLRIEGNRELALMFGEIDI